MILVIYLEVSEVLSEFLIFHSSLRLPNGGFLPEIYRFTMGETFLLPPNSYLLGLAYQDQESLLNISARLGLDLHNLELTPMEFSSTQGQLLFEALASTYVRQIVNSVYQEMEVPEAAVERIILHGITRQLYQTIFPDGRAFAFVVQRLSEDPSDAGSRVEDPGIGLESGGVRGLPDRDGLPDLNQRPNQDQEEPGLPDLNTTPDWDRLSDFHYPFLPRVSLDSVDFDLAGDTTSLITLSFVAIRVLTLLSLYLAWAVLLYKIKRQYRKRKSIR